MAWTLIERISAFQGRWIETGVAGTSGPEARALLERLAPDMVAVERPVWIAAPKLVKAGPHLLRTSWEGGGWRMLAAALGIRAVYLSAGQWRLWLCGSNSPEDSEIAAALPRALVDIPKRTSNHARDAAGVAWAGLRLPADWEAACARIEAAKAAQAGAKAAGRKRMKAIAKRLSVIR